MSGRIKQFMISFISIFCLANFVVGSVAGIFVSGKGGPIPEFSTICFLGIASAIVASIRLFYEH